MRKRHKRYLLQTGLFIATLFTTTSIGASYAAQTGDSAWEQFCLGFYYSIPFLGILTFHEFGHYITARIYKVKVTLPYYIPFVGPIGTMGAFIRIKSILKSRKEIFDIGIAGPLAGFVVAIALLYYGFTHLPPQEYIFEVHPEYKKYGLNYAEHVYKKENSDSLGMLMSTGSNLIFEFFKNYVVEDPSRIPNKYETIHYPFLFAGYLALFFTALNLIPVGQLDGGHIIYGLFGRRHKIVSPLLFVVFVTVCGIGIFNDEVIAEGFIPLANMENLLVFGPLYLVFLYFLFSKTTDNKTTNFLIAISVFTFQYLVAVFFPEVKAFWGYLFFAFLVGRFLGVHHPSAYYEEPLDLKRKILGWLTLIIFIIAFSPNPITFE